MRPQIIKPGPVAFMAVGLPVRWLALLRGHRARQAGNQAFVGEPHFVAEVSLPRLWKARLLMA